MIRGTKALLRPSVAIVGAGPAGLAAMGVLLDLGLSKLVWIDPDFDGGRLAKYEEVPSNTKVKLFTDFGQGCKSFLGAKGDDAVAPFKNLNPEEGCDLGCARRMVREMTHHLRQEGRSSGRVNDMKGRVTKIEHDTGAKWEVFVDKDGEEAVVDADMVFLATGSEPRSLSLHRTLVAADSPYPQEIHLDVALSPSALASAVRPHDTVAVVGSSHSAVLVLKNLTELPPTSRPKSVVNFYRSPLLYAEYRNDEHGAWIFRDNTGLKGLAAQWARQHLEGHPGGGGYGGASDSPLVRRVEVAGQPAEADDVYRRELPACSKIVYAVGYSRVPLPQVVYRGSTIADAAIIHNDSTGQLLMQSKPPTPIPGLYGWGIAFPELWTDPWGNREASVGLFKFLRYAKRAVPSAVKAHA